MDIPFHSDEAKTINKLIFETMYHAALEKSNELSKVRQKDILKLKKARTQWKFLEKNPDCTDYILDGPQFQHDEIRQLLDKHKPIEAEITPIDPTIELEFA